MITKNDLVRAMEYLDQMPAFNSRQDSENQRAYYNNDKMRSQKFNATFDDLAALFKKHIKTKPGYCPFDFGKTPIYKNRGIRYDHAWCAFHLPKQNRQESLQFYLEFLKEDNGARLNLGISFWNQANEEEYDKALAKLSEAKEDTTNIIKKLNGKKPIYIDAEDEEVSFENFIANPGSMYLSLSIQDLMSLPDPLQTLLSYADTFYSFFLKLAPVEA